MPTYVAFLRAINVTGRFVKMAALADAFRTLGYTDARTYINSGNVIFTSPLRAASKLQPSLEDSLEPILGFRSEAFVRTAAQVHAIAAHANTLLSQAGPTGEVNVCFLPGAIEPSPAAALSALKNDVDDFDVQASEIYWLCRTNQSASKFSNTVLERRLKLRTTLRRASMLQGLTATL